MSEQIGAEVSAWDGYISGRNLELVPGQRIVQSWRTSEFADEQGDSVITILLQEADEGTLLTLEHSNVPDEQRSYEETGWQENYFEPMVVYFTDASEEPRQRRRQRRRPKLRPSVQPRRRATPSAQPVQNQSAQRHGQRLRQASAKVRVGRPAARLPQRPRANAPSRLKEIRPRQRALATFRRAQEGRAAYRNSVRPWAARLRGAGAGAAAAG